MFFCVILAVMFLPPSLNRVNINASTSLEGDAESNPYGITYHMMYTNKKAFINMTSGTAAMIFMVCFDSILSLRLKEFNLEDHAIGYVFAVPCLCYAISASLVGTICQNMRRHNVTFIAFLFNTMALCVLGPSKMLHLPNNLWVLLVGLAFMGFAHAFIIVPLVPEIIHAIIDKEGLPDPPPHILNDKVSGLFGFFYAAGCITGPILGGALTDIYSFRVTCDIMAILSLIYSVIFFLNI